MWDRHIERVVDGDDSENAPVLVEHGEHEDVDVRPSYSDMGAAGLSVSFVTHPKRYTLGGYFQCVFRHIAAAFEHWWVPRLERPPYSRLCEDMAASP